MHDLYDVTWQYTGELTGSQTMLLCVGLPLGVQIFTSYVFIVVNISYVN